MSRSSIIAGRLAKLLGAFCVGREGVAAIEFALVMPALLALYAGSIEVTQLISTDQRVTTVSGTVGDLVARMNGEIDSARLTDYFQAAQSILSPYSTAGLKQVVSVVAVDSNGVTNVVWSQPYNGGTARTKNQPFTNPNALPASMTDIAKNSYIIVSEASYTYNPMLRLFLQNPVPLYHQSFYLPRYASVICYNQAPPCP